MEKKDNGYLIGSLGAFVGGMVATIPWILCYVYANMMYSILALLIGIGAFKGYELVKGKMGKPVPIIIGVVSFIAITLATLVIIPNLLLINEYGKTSLSAFKLLYAFGDFKSAIMKDYIYSLLFTALGISGILANIKKGIKNGDTKIDLMAPAYSPSDEEINAVKKVFEKHDATNKDHTITKETVLKEIKDKENVFNFLKARGIIVKKNGGYYYSIENEQNPSKRTMKIVIWSIVATIGLIAFAIVLGIVLS